ncbi:MAG: hypothetical protein QNJ74_05385 [Trichodesmium sp. MO_231.B1]|nr:hypothetical protein [Trichodesmium sp. MO_231.B1]
MMKYILTGLRELLPEQEQENLSDEIISKIIEIHAPLGLKKQIIYLDSSINPELDPHKLPAYQKVQKADINELLDDLGDYLTSVKKYPQGKIPENERTKFLNNEVVGFFYSELKKLVASLNPENLPEYLISYHEAIVGQVNEHRLTIPTRLACFSSIPERYENIQKEMLENNQAALASRFIIEYVVAQPPTGMRPFSLSIYHRLQALGYQIINFGFKSDLINFSLADFQLSILPSGRLGTDTKEYEKARETHLSIFMSGETTRITESFERYWKTPQIPTEKSEIVKKIDAAASIEFGYSITEICELLEEAIDIGKKFHPTVICLPLESFITHLATQLNWNEEKVTKAIELLSLSQRSDFLKPDKPFQGRDIYPWKFNRLLSYLRRPFLQRQKNNKVEIIWGIRHLYEAQEYLIQLFLTGRLQAKSKEMKEVISKITNQTGEDFNNKIADWFQQDSKLIVRRKVEKIGKIKIQGKKGKLLGDIDVLVADPKNLCIKIVECKNFSMARAPNQMKNELDELFMGRGKGESRKKSTVEHHQERVKWVNNHLQEVLIWLSLNPNLNWKVEAIIVTDEELSTPHLKSSPIPVISWIELCKKRELN